MTIPLIGFLFLYLLFVFIWLIFSIIALYHIIRYGQINFTTFLTTFIYPAVSVIILYLSYQYLSQIDWSVSFNLFSGGSNIFGSSF